MLAQTRAGAKGALLFHSCAPVSEFGGMWPNGVPSAVDPPARETAWSAGIAWVDGRRDDQPAATTPHASLMIIPEPESPRRRHLDFGCRLAVAVFKATAAPAGALA